MDSGRIEAARATALYRWFDADDALLYVGITRALRARTKEHQESQPWWRAVRRAEVEWFPTREEARYAEIRAIRFEEPLHNSADRRPSVEECRRTRESLWSRLVDYEPALKELELACESPSGCATMWWLRVIRPEIRRLVGWGRLERPLVDENAIARDATAFLNRYPDQGEHVDDQWGADLDLVLWRHWARDTSVESFIDQSSAYMLVTERLAVTGPGCCEAERLAP
jgi:predicted GIY-YIG superfamily endonuclease